MQLHLLLTEELSKTMPETCNVDVNYGTIGVIFGQSTLIEGENVILSDSMENFKNWLRPHGDIPVGNGVPQLEQFELLRIAEDK